MKNIIILILTFVIFGLLYYIRLLNVEYQEKINTATEFYNSKCNKSKIVYKLYRSN